MATDLAPTGHPGALTARRWDPCGEPRCLALLLHGHGEYLGRHDHVGARLTHGSALGYAVEHAGHGRSEGERVLVGGARHEVVNETNRRDVLDDVAAFVGRHPGTRGGPPKRRHGRS